MRDFMKNINYFIFENLVFIIICIIIIFVFGGCSTKTIGSSESSAQILNNYVKKPLPEGWYWNFGIGPNYSKAFSDADLSLISPTNVNVRVSVTGENYVTDKNGKMIASGNNHHRFLFTEPYVSYGSKNWCEVRESWDVPEGIMIVRVCPDTNFFGKNLDFKQTEDERKKNVKWSFELGKVTNYIDKKLNIRDGIDKKYLIGFKEEYSDLDTYILMANFYDDVDNASENIIEFLESSYKKWYYTLGSFKDPYLKRYYGIMYPYTFRSNDDYRAEHFIPNQLWKLTENGVIVGRKLKVSDIQLIGITPMPESSIFEYYSKKPPQFNIK